MLIWNPRMFLQCSISSQDIRVEALRFEEVFVWWQWWFLSALWMIPKAYLSKQTCVAAVKHAHYVQTTDSLHEPAVPKLKIQKHLRKIQCHPDLATLDSGVNFRKNTRPGFTQRRENSLGNVVHKRSGFCWASGFSLGAPLCCENENIHPV